MSKETVPTLYPHQWGKFSKYAHYDLKMNFLYGFIVSLLFIPGCSTNPAPDEDQVVLVTDQTKYLVTDTLTVVITNHTKDVYYIGLRCGAFLEMSYQKKDAGEWSGNQWFGYMSLLCATEIDSILPEGYYSYKMPTDIFEGIGTFRLVMEQWYSNEFKINEDIDRVQRM